MPELRLEHSLVDGRYEVYERLSRGSYAEIFVAYDRQAGRVPVVIKALNTSLQGTPDPDLERTLVENFQNEAIALDAVRHPHVILRTGHGTAADLRGVPFHYLVLEYMPGGDLLELCRHRPSKALPLDEALFYFHQACEALSYAHSKGIIHRDLKPNNFLLSADKRTLKIADFGVAKIATGEAAEITRVGADVYAPPEHNPNEEAAESHHLTESADVYSLAKSFYTVVCGRAPNQFRCDPIRSLPETVMQEPWAKALRDVLCHATEDDPNARYATVGEFWHELAQVAVLAPAIKAEGLPDEETIVKPRLSVQSAALPRTPVSPDFDPTPATSQLQETVATAMPVETPTAAEPVPEAINGEPRREGLNHVNHVEAPPFIRHAERPGKIFIELQPQQVTPIATAPAAQPPQQHRPPRPAEKRPQAKPPAKPYVPPAGSKFSEKVRRRIFIMFLVAAFAGLLISVYNTFRTGTFGTPREIEVLTDQLNVRPGPSTGFTEIGTIAKGTHHRVITQNEQGWMQIEVSQWMTLKSGTYADVRQGWVNGNAEYVKVVSRRWW